MVNERFQSLWLGFEPMNKRLIHMTKEVNNADGVIICGMTFTHYIGIWQQWTMIMPFWIYVQFAFSPCFSVDREYHDYGTI